MDTKIETKQLTDGSEPEQELVRNRDGSDRIVYRKNGMFAKRIKEDLSLDHIQAATVARLTDEDEDGKSPYQKAVDNVVKNAGLDCEQPVFDRLGNLITKEDGTPLTVKDSKMAMASSKSLDSVAKLMGLPKKEVEQKFEVKIVNVGSAETARMIFERQGGVIPEYPGYHRPPAQPNFAEVTEIYTNEPKPTPAQPTERKQPTKRENVDVEWLMQCNSAEITKRTSGVPMSAVHAKAQTDLPVRVTSRNLITAGWYRVASASISSQATIAVEVEE